MRRYSGYLRYSTNNSGREGRDVYVDLRVSFFPGRFTIAIQDEIARSRHVLTNRRFNYQARDSPQDLLAREKWRSFWFDRFSGAVYLSCPRITGVPRELQVHVICSWDPAFGVVEFKYGDTFYQLACRPPRGVNAWAREPFRSESIPDDDPPNEPSSDSRNPPPDDVIHDLPTVDDTPKNMHHHHLFGGKWFTGIESSLFLVLSWIARVTPWCGIGESLN